MKNFSYLSVLSIVCFTCLTACGMMPDLLKTAEDVIDDNAITQTVSRESLGRQTNVRCTIELDNGQIQQQK